MTVSSMAANCELAITYVLQWEDATLSGVVTSDRGGRTRWGIAERFHGDLTSTGFFDRMSNPASLLIAKGIYEEQYCNPLCIGDMCNQDVANKVLSLGVNIGVTAVARMLQDAVGVIGDGRIGPLTLDALDKADPLMVLADLRAAACAHYRNIVNEDPSQAKFLNGWLRRANA